MGNEVTSWATSYQVVNPKESIEQMEETCLRLHVYLKRQLEEHQDTWPNLMKKIESGGTTFYFSRKQKVAMSEYHEYMYYKGKLMAYLWALENMGHPRVPSLIYDLRGMEYDPKTNQAPDTKHVKSWETKGP